jgi:hypothetical protein
MGRSQTVDDTVYNTLTKVLKITPEEDESEQDFYARTVKVGAKLSEKKFEALPEECQDWLDEATTAFKEKVAIPAMPGADFDAAEEDEVVSDEDEDTSPDDPEEEEEEEAPTPKKAAPKAKAKAKAKVEEVEDEGEEEEEDEPAPKKAAVKAKATKAAPVAKKTKAAPEPAEEDAEEEEEEEAPPKKSAVKGKSGVKAREEKAAADPKKKAAAVKDKRVQKRNQVIRSGRSRSTDGVLYKLMEAMYEDPTLKASELAAVVEKENKVKAANAIGIRQQYRRIVFFLQDKGVVSGMIKERSAD